MGLLRANSARAGVGASVACLVAACGGSHQATVTASTAAAARCVPAPIHRGAPPAWTAAAWAGSNRGFRVPYALGSHDAAGAFFFAPLRAGHPSNPSNKVLWIVRFPRNGHALTITARLSTEPSEVVHTSWPANSAPGEIYPSGVDLPKPGCWRLSLAWGPHRASIDVEVRR